MNDAARPYLCRLRAARQWTLLCRRHVEYYNRRLALRSRLFYLRRCGAGGAEGANKIRGRIDIGRNECRAVNGPLIIRARRCGN